MAVLGAAQGSAPEIVYDVTLDVAGVRLVEQVVEFLNRDGVPRLRMAAPLVRDANCTRVLPKVTVVGVALTNAAGNLPVAPGATALQIKVGWNEQGLTYPVVVDPSWTTTMVMSTAVELPAYVSVPATVLKPSAGWRSRRAACDRGRRHHASCNRAGRRHGAHAGVSVGDEGLADAREHAGRRRSHTLNLTGAAQNQIIAVGSQNSANDYMMTTPVYSLVDGVWTTPTQQLKRKGACRARSVTLNDGRVMVTGGHSPARVNVELYNPTNNSWLYNGTKLALGRINHTAVTLADGRVFVAGGWNITRRRRSSSRPMQVEHGADDERARRSGPAESNEVDGPRARAYG